MSRSREPNDVDLQFLWGKKRGIGGAKRDIQFYESFTYDDVNYSIYDCVYLFKKDESEPYIGKIVKIWEQPDRKKKVKILWFFRPTEILNYLGDHMTLEKEILLASGEGVGLANVNPLEAIAGKCCVICTSKDERNPQPSKDALETADYIFHRTFDVGNFRISDEIPDKIAGVEVRYLLNRKEDQKPGCVFKPQASEIDGNGKTEPSTPFSLEKNMKFGERGLVPNAISKDNAVEGKHPKEGNHEKRATKVDNDSVKDVGQASKPLLSCIEENMNSAKNKAYPNEYNDRPSKMMKLSDASVKPSDDLQRNMKLNSGQKINEDDSGKGFVRLPKGSSDNLKLSERKPKPSCDSVRKNSSSAPLENGTKVEHQIVEVNKRPNADRSKWFNKKGLPWEGRLQDANEKGTLVFLENFDRSLTAADIEDIMFETFKQSCTAKMIAESMFHNPHYGQAYVIFKTQEAADMVVRQISMGCLLLSDGRPLVASKGLLKLPPKSSTLTGHLSIDKIKIQMQREEMRRAVSTSHCSQPNTIEYEMAMDWMLIQEKSVNCFNRLFKGHGDEVNQVRNSLKPRR